MTAELNAHKEAPLITISEQDLTKLFDLNATPALVQQAMTPMSEAISAKSLLNIPSLIG